MEKSSRSFSILYSDLQYLGAIKTPDPELGYLGFTKTQDLEFEYLGATKSTVISKLLSRIISLRTYFLVIMENSSRLLSILYSDLQYLGAIKTPDPEFWVPGSHQNSGSRVRVPGSHQNSGSGVWVPRSHQKHCNFQITEQNCQFKNLFSSNYGK